MAIETRLRTLLRQVEADVQQLSAQLAQRQKLRQHLQASLGQTSAVSFNVTTPGKPTGKRPAAGTIPGRVLDIVGEFDAPVLMRDILGAKHGAKHHHITTAVTALVRSGHLVATGATSSRRYSLPVVPRKGRK
jgi:hypothetical protein